jgi:tetratricopeptide (TPR) repeat protein
MANYRADAYMGRGRALYDHGDVDAARADFEKALAIDPNNVPALTGLGNCYFRKDDWDCPFRDFITVRQRG